MLDVAIIGAGPYGLSVAAHLRGRGINHRIFGEPMSAWQNNMPSGMHLKSDGSSSDLSDPDGLLTLEKFCADRGLEYDRRFVPVALDTFVSYGLAFQQRFAPRVERKQLVKLRHDGDAHILQFDDGETIAARHVVIAVGVVPFKYIPAQLSHLPAELASHSGNYGPLDRFAGRDVTVLGAGSSALDMAALLSERGAQVTLVTRRPQLAFHAAPKTTRNWRRELLHYCPSSKIGGGWLLRLCDDYPEIIHMLPEQQRLAIVKNVLGPSGGYFIKDRVLGKVDVRCGRRLKETRVQNGQASLETVTPDGRSETIETDHLIMATGYKADLGRLPFLGLDLVRSIRTVENTPVLSANYESSVPGLHFVGLAAANSFGPVMRFVAGAPHPARRLAHYLSKALVRRLVSVPVVAPT
jgi:thioredoxin reductase